MSLAGAAGGSQFSVLSKRQNRVTPFVKDYAATLMDAISPLSTLPSSAALSSRAPTRCGVKYSRFCCDHELRFDLDQ